MKKFFSIFLCLLIFFTSTFIPHAYAADSYEAGQISTSSSALNIRSSPSTSASIIGSLPMNSYVMLLGKTGQWWRVEYKSGAYGYCSNDYIKTVSSTPATVSISSGYLNIRSGAGTSYSVTAKLNKGDTVLILGSSNGWYRILFDGTKTGYASANYITENTGSANNTTTTPPQGYVYLNVPDYKQTDPRWSGVTLGSSGRTIGSIGCTTTCLAMTESFRTKTTIYPDAMSKKLTYSSTGSLYWPSNYRTDTSVSYEKIKSVLSAGKPVILGLTTSAGSTHWVVVKEISGSTYYVNDPGSNTRKTLSDVLAKYPNFYKMAYYA